MTNPKARALFFLILAVLALAIALPAQVSLSGFVAAAGALFDFSSAGTPFKLPTITTGVWNGSVITAPYLPLASSAALGVVQGDGSTLSISGPGVVSCTTATTSQLGCVQPDGTTVSVSAGVISVSSTPAISWTGLPYNAFFQDEGGRSQTGQYGKDASGRIWIRGVSTCVSTGTASGTVAVLPAGFRPIIQNIYLPGAGIAVAGVGGTNVATPTTFQVTSGGSLVILAGSAFSCVSGTSEIFWDGMSFTAN